MTRRGLGLLDLPDGVLMKVLGHVGTVDEGFCAKLKSSLPLDTKEDYAYVKAHYSYVAAAVCACRRLRDVARADPVGLWAPLMAAKLNNSSEQHPLQGSAKRFRLLHALTPLLPEAVLVSPEILTGICGHVGLKGSAYLDECDTRAIEALSIVSRGAQRDQRLCDLLQSQDPAALFKKIATPGGGLRDGHRVVEIRALGSLFGRGPCAAKAVEVSPTFSCPRDCAAC